MAKTILLVEDDEILREMYARKFALAGFAVIKAVDGYDGLEKLKEKESVSLIILDIMLPRLNGIEVLKKIKANPMTKNIPVIVLTDFGVTEEDKKEALDLGAINYLIKADLTPNEVVEKARATIKE